VADNDAVLALARKIADNRAKQLEAMKITIQAKYPQADADSLRYDEAAGKFAVTINCEDCGDARDPVFTSDLFQVTLCKTCAARAKAVKKLGKKALLAQAIALIEAGGIKPKA
jgi:ribosomal protein S27E